MSEAPTETPLTIEALMRALAGATTTTDDRGSFVRVVSYDDLMSGLEREMEAARGK